MDLIFELIQTFEEDDLRDFRIFLNRFRNRKERKDLDLFDLLSKEKITDREYLLERLYKGDLKNLGAYHATRKRLIRQLMEFIFLKKGKNENSGEGYVRHLLLLSRYLFDQGREQAAWSFLKQAEELSRKSEDYKLLNEIFSFQIEQSQSEYAPDLKKILSEKMKYQQLALEDDNANMANHLIRYELNVSLSTGKEIDIEKIIRKVLREYKLTEAVITRPRLIYNIISITRSAVLAHKDFYTFEPYVIEKYREIEERGNFNKYNHFYKVDMLYMIAHVLYRNKKFTEAESYLKVLYAGMLEYNKSHFLQFYTRYNLLLAAVYNYSGRNKEAIGLLEKLLSDQKIRLEKADLLNTYLNLSIYYFQRDEYGKSVRLFQNVQHSDRWLMKIMGFEWVLKKNIIECINQFELGNANIVEQRLKQIQKNFGDYFERPMYRRVGKFLELVKALNNDPSIATGKEFYNKIENSFEFIDPAKEDIQAMTFFGWLKAKMQRRKYYEVLLELVNLR